MNAQAPPFVPSLLNQTSKTSSTTPCSSTIEGAKDHCQNNSSGKKTKSKSYCPRRTGRPRRARRQNSAPNNNHEKNNVLHTTPQNDMIYTNRYEYNDSTTIHNDNNDENEKLCISCAPQSSSSSTTRHSQQNLTKHEKHNQRKQRRRRRRTANKEHDNNNNNVHDSYNDHHEMDAKDDANHKHNNTERRMKVGKEQYQPRRIIATTNHRKQRGKRQTNLKATSTTGCKHEDTPTNNNHASVLSLDDKCNFPTLTTSSTPAAIAKSNKKLENDDETSWKNECLANKIATSLELEAQQEMQRQVEQLQQMGEQKAQLTTLTSKSLHTIDRGIEGVNELGCPIEYEEEESSSLPRSTALSSVVSSAVDTSSNKNMIPNTNYANWTESKLSKMRKRWWEAVRAKRKKAEEDRVKKRLEVEQEGALLLANGNWCDNENDNGEDSSLESSSHSSSSLSSPGNVAKLERSNFYDPMEPPSLTTPFDEMVSVSEPRPPSPTIMPFIRPTASQSVLDLEQKCLQSLYPLHCVIYNIALSQGEKGLDNYCGNDGDSYKKSDAEVVLHRLLTKHEAEEVLKWKNKQVSMSQIRGLEGTSNYDKSRVDTLTNAKVDILSADIASLTPLQLAIYWNQPKAIRLLHSTTTTNDTNMKHSGEEDEHGRTPLMLACELSHAECIQALMCASHPRKLDRRERKGGNTAFHFCCIGSNYGNLPRVYSGDDDDNDVEGKDVLDLATSVCVDSLDVLLRYTSVKDQKRALMTTNRNGHNLLHLACRRGDLILLECLLEQYHNIPGVNVSKALDVKDMCGYTPFLAAVAHDSIDIVTHLLSTRISYSSWFEGFPLLVAVSKRSLPMVKLLLETGYCCSPGMPVQDEVNRALLEVIYMGNEEGSRSYSYQTNEMILHLISQGGANPHLPVMIEFPGKPNIKGDGLIMNDKLSEDSPLSAAVRAADVEAIRCMMNAYSACLRETKQQRRDDPIRQSLPESYFQLQEEKEDELVYFSVDAAIVTSLFLLWKNGCSSYGRCALVLYDMRARDLSSTGSALSQRALHWLEWCVSMGRFVPLPPKQKIDAKLDDFLLEAPQIRYSIPSCSRSTKSKDLYKNSGATVMDWSLVLAGLPWFRSQSINCNWMKGTMSDLSETSEVDRNTAVIDDEFYLVVQGTKLLAHKSIVSAHCGKLAAQIRFTESNTQELLQDRLVVQVDNISSPLVAKMLLCHCYHGSILFGLRKTPTEQLIELATLADEYLCPSLLLECELRLLERRSASLCLCSHCSGGTVLSKERVECPIILQQLEKAKNNLHGDLSLHCNPVGVHIYKTSSAIMSSNQDKSFITAENGLDILAIAQQLESSCCQQGIYRIYQMKYCQSATAADPKATKEAILNNIFDGICSRVSSDYPGCWNSGSKRHIPFAAAKEMAVWTMLCNFPRLLKSDSYLQQRKHFNGGDENDTAEEDASFAITRTDKDECAIFVLQTCLEILASRRT